MQLVRKNRKTWVFNKENGQYVHKTHYGNVYRLRRVNQHKFFVEKNVNGSWVQDNDTVRPLKIES